MMTLDRFEDLAGLLGPDLARWPEAERGAAQAFMAANPQAARAALAQVSALNDLLESARDAVPGLALYDAVIASAPAAHDAAPRWSAMAAAAALLVGVSAGWLTTEPPNPMTKCCLSAPLPFWLKMRLTGWRRRRDDQAQYLDHPSDCLGLGQWCPDRCRCPYLVGRASA